MSVASARNTSCSASCTTRVASTALGIDLATARAALEAMDTEALAAVGVDATGLRLGSGTDRAEVSSVRVGRIPFTASAKDTLSRMLRIASGRRATRLEPQHLLLALLDAAATDPVTVLLRRLDIDPDALRGRLGEAA